MSVSLTTRPRGNDCEMCGDRAEYRVNGAYDLCMSCASSVKNGYKSLPGDDND